MSFFKKIQNYCFCIVVFGVIGCSENELTRIAPSPDSSQIPENSVERLKHSDKEKTNKTVIARIIGPEELLRKTAASIESLLGKPSFVRTEGEAVVFQYARNWCIFDIVFYGEDGAKRAKYYEFRAKDKREIDISKCLSKIVNRENFE